MGIQGIAVYGLVDRGRGSSLMAGRLVPRINSYPALNSNVFQSGGVEFLGGLIPRASSIFFHGSIEDTPVPSLGDGKPGFPADLLLRPVMQTAIASWGRFLLS